MIWVTAPPRDGHAYMLYVRGASDAPTEKLREFAEKGMICHFRAKSKLEDVVPVDLFEVGLVLLACEISRLSRTRICVQVQSVTYRIEASIISVN